ncbi:uncharacterized protein BJ212DRAFT_1412071 [Suillus subaureus]|uniref:Uncharacterized protein n=1 Tax=Suillus subaureus TaxID=48587 RepID=A0A9P7ARI4_9AGAM|nr:uncharacterized protein BJ212DRAFT_1412071 [Suillus subaureus]KAG1794762.1 hypothetical protein BJ212DRAFT_1412071 [Suillus subaureus]
MRELALTLLMFHKSDVCRADCKFAGRDNDDAFKTDLLILMSDTEPKTNNQLKRRTKAVLRETKPTLTSVHGVKTFGILDGMIGTAQRKPVCQVVYATQHLPS